MLFPIGKIEIQGEKRVSRSYLFYNDETKKAEIRSKKDLLKSLDNVNGFLKTGSAVRLKSHFTNIPIIGEGGTTDVNHYTVIENQFRVASVDFLLVDKYTQKLTVTKDELIQMIKDGVQISGVKLNENDKLSVSGDIKVKCINNYQK